MIDAEIFTAIRAYLVPIMGADPLPFGNPVVIVQKQQPQAQGIPNGFTVFMEKITDKRYGFPRMADVWNADLEILQHIHKQNIETTIQLSAIAPRITNGITGTTSSNLTATSSDVLQYVADALQNTNAVEYFQTLGAGVLRVTDVRNGYFISDEDRNTANVSFDLTVLHERVTITQQAEVATFDFDIKRV